ncbi:probable disease resistance protein At4g27220 [Gossypium raimondii]|uniref:Uncharacterized protein n=1 Tax=Gossypium raimondii TaxID=29730 RepID=A0A0D2TCV1_GOSRA|nr:probable disease resistance protein At4g27220 [Gossypium raimondii]KJB73523.1 hypothetical protein B456_011G237700 [Gossypium raimondii]MBA0600385.1 hypothetical protein [Gossypium raimondii]
MAELIGPILDVIKFIGRKASKYLKFQRKFTEYVDDFNQAQEDLRAKEADFRQQLKDEHHFGKMPKQEVERWFEKVEQKLGHAQHVEDKISKGKYLFRSCFGKLVDEATQAMKEVRAEGNFSGGLVVNDPSTIAVNLPTPEVVGAIDVREEIYQYLMGDAVGLIGVWGMGGIGKTTIMKDVHNRLLKESKFRKLIWVTVSQDFDIRRLQNNIASQLERNLSDDEDTIVRAGKLSEMLKGQMRYVLILDDVWRSLSLEDFGILEPATNNGCKLVLTTRSERVVESMGLKKVKVPCFSMEEAMNLFLSKVGQDMLPNPTLESLMKLAVRECDGLPLAVVTLAGCMRGKSDPRMWENAIDELRGYIRNIHDMEDRVYGCLKFSYDRLQRIHQDCLLYCALYPEDHEIYKDEITEKWMEEGLIDEMGSRKAMEGSSHSILQELEENCLLERVQDRPCIKMHDLVRDMALHITRKRFLVKAGMQLEELPNEEDWGEDLEKVSLMHNCISTIPQMMKSPKFPKLTTLLLSWNALKEIPESFFEHFPNLKILDLSDTRLESLPNSISFLEKLTVLLLRGCLCLKRLPCLSKLQALKKLDLGSSGIREIPQGLEMLVNLRYLNLKYTSHLAWIPTGTLSKLCRLQYLAIHLKLSAKELRELNKLEVFEGWFHNVGDLNTFASKRKTLYKFSILVCYQMTSFRPSTSSNLVTFVRVTLDVGDEIILPYGIEKLSLLGCGGVRSINDFGLRDATDLKVCELRVCRELESVISSQCEQLQTLESLYLSDLENLKVIVEVGAGESSVGIFSSLRRTCLSRCGKIKKLFSADWVLSNLEEIDVDDCSELEEIITESEKKRLGSNKDTIKFPFPKLRFLLLNSLVQLQRICSENGVMVCDSLQHISISDCPKLKRIPLCLPQLEIDDEGKLSPSNSLQRIQVHPIDWWEAVEWEHPNFNIKKVVRPLVRFRKDIIEEWRSV